MADINSTLPVTDSADGTDGAAAPALAIQVAGKDGSGNLQTLLTDTTGALKINNKVAQTPSSPTVVSVGIASTSVVAANANRTGLVLVNNSTAKIYLGFGTAAVLGSGILLLPGGVYVMDSFIFTVGTVAAIASVATSSLTVQEYS